MEYYFKMRYVVKLYMDFISSLKLSTPSAALDRSIVHPEITTTIGQF